MTATDLPRSRRALVALLASLLPAAAAAGPLTIDEAIRAAWSTHPLLAASQAGAEAARADAERAGDSRWPTLSLTAKAVRTDEPMMAFGIRLDQGRITQADFDPAKLNDPASIGAVGGGVSLQVPLYMGGRLVAGQRAAGAVADAEQADHSRRKLEVAALVVEAYFGAQAAEQGIRWADDLTAQATETERFVRERAAQGLALDADLARAVAFRAQAEAERATAVQRRASARSALALLAGAQAGGAELTSPIEALPPAPAGTPESLEARPDVQAARLREQAASAGVTAARGAFLPAVFAQGSAELLRTPDLSEGTAWTSLGLVARWDLSLGDVAAHRAATARARAAAEARTYRELAAARDLTEAEQAELAATARVRAAVEAVAASESARTLRTARHRQGLLPLTDVLDAEAGLAGARALLLASRVEARLARARHALALHQPIEGLTP